MNAIEYALNEISHQIPQDLLYAAMVFEEDHQIVALTSTLDKVRNKVINKRVLLATNMIGGMELLLPLQTMNMSFYDNLYTVYEVPPEPRMFRDIVSALHLSYLPNSGFFAYGGGMPGTQLGFGPMGPAQIGQSPLLSAAGRVSASVASPGVISNAHLEIVAPNCIAVYANYRTLGNVGIRVVVENENNLNNLSPRSYQHFSTLCVLATKAYIYNRLRVAINQGYLASGQELGVFVQILDSYADANEQYETYLREQWGAVAYMNDTTRYNNFLSGLIAPNL